MIIYNEELGTRGGFDTMKWVFLLNKNDFEDTNQYQKLNEYCCIRKSKYFEVKKLCDVYSYLYYHNDNTNQVI